MDVLRQVTRRNVLRSMAATAASLTLPSPSFAQSVASVVVIGGGFGGAACARAPRVLGAQEGDSGYHRNYREAKGPHEGVPKGSCHGSADLGALGR